MALQTLDIGIGARDVDALRGRLHGELIQPGDERYDAARRVLDTATDRRPAFVVRADNAADVVRTVRFAADRGLPFAVRSGAHSVAGHGTVDDGVVLDLSRMHRVAMDPRRREGQAQGGTTAITYTEEAHRFGLATPFGDTGTVGLGGLTTGGGIGYLVRKHGLTIDSLLAVEVVTPDGRLITASEDEHADLFWAVRGGGGNFGVVTEFRYRLHPVGTVFGGSLNLPASPGVLRGFEAAAEAAPDELTTIAAVRRAFPGEPVPSGYDGQLMLNVLPVYSGAVAPNGGPADPDAGPAALAPIRALAPAISDDLRHMPYPDIYRYTEGASMPHAFGLTCVYVDGISGGAGDVILDFMERAVSPMAMVQVRPLGGAMARVPSDATAFAHRSARTMVLAVSPFRDLADAETHHRWAREFREALRPFETGTYVNFLGDEGDERIREAYPATTYARLAAVKAAYDPTNFLRLNQNIRPASR